MVTVSRRIMHRINAASYSLRAPAPIAWTSAHLFRTHSRPLVTCSRTDQLAALCFQGKKPGQVSLSAAIKGVSVARHAAHIPLGSHCCRRASGGSRGEQRRRQRGVQRRLPAALYAPPSGFPNSVCPRAAGDLGHCLATGAGDKRTRSVLGGGVPHPPVGAGARMAPPSSSRSATALASTRSHKRGHARHAMKKGAQRQLHRRWGKLVAEGPTRTARLIYHVALAEAPAAQCCACGGGWARRRPRTRAGQRRAVTTKGLGAPVHKIGNRGGGLALGNRHGAVVAADVDDGPLALTPRDVHARPGAAAQKEGRLTATNPGDRWGMHLYNTKGGKCIHGAMA